VILYRYEDSDDVYPILSKYFVLRETPEGYWIKKIIHEPTNTDMEIFLSTTKKWMSKRSQKRFAFETEGQAMYSYFRRKKEQQRIIEGQYNKVRNIVNYLTTRIYPEDPIIQQDVFIEEVRDVLNFKKQFKHTARFSDITGFIKSDEMKVD